MQKMLAFLRYICWTLPAIFIKFWGGRAGAICWTDMEWPYCWQLLHIAWQE